MRKAVLFLGFVLMLETSLMAQDVLVTVNGVSFKRKDVMERAFRQYGTATLNEMVDELLIAQAARELKVKADPKEVEARIKRIQAQLPDEATFRQRLAATGSSPEALRTQIEGQILRERLVVKAKNLGLTEVEIKNFFEANQERLGVPQALRLRQILLGSEKEANDFLVALRAGADFAKLASQVSLDNATKANGGDMGYIAAGMLLPEIEKVVFGLKAGEESPVVKTQMGFHLFKAEEIRPAKPALFHEVQKDLREALLADKISKAWPDYLKELREKAKYAPAAGASRQRQ